MSAGPFPSKEQFIALRDRPAFARAREGMPDVLQDQATTGTPYNVRQIVLHMSDNTGRQNVQNLITELQVRLPSVQDLPSSLTVKVGNANVPLSEPLRLKLDGDEAWLVIPVGLAVADYTSILITFGTPYQIIGGMGSENNYALVAECFSDLLQMQQVCHAAIRVIRSGPRSLLGRIAPDAMNTVPSPTPAAQMAEGDIEVVLGASDPVTAPVLRMKSGGQVWKLDFVAEDTGGSIST